MRHVVRAAAYVPSGVFEGRSVAALDEDSFTLAATAAERAWSGRREEPGPILAHLLGDLPPAVEWGFASLLGREVVVSRGPNDATEFVRALRELEGGTGGAALLVAAELPERGAATSSPREPAPGAAAVAFLLEPTDVASPLPLGKPVAGRSALAAAFRVGEPGKAAPHGVTFVGDWEWTADGGRPVTVSPRELSPGNGLDAVSEGAYVPRARYVENLPSRWRFLAESCGACHHTTFPARRICRFCGRTDSLTPVDLPTDGGRVVAVTTVGAGGQPTEFDQQVKTSGPYDVALVELARGMRVTLQVTDTVPGTLRVGDHVHTFLRRLYPMEGEWRYGRKAVPVPLASTARTPSDPAA